MGASTPKQFPTPDPTTQPPDVPHWLQQLAQAIDDSIKYGPVANVPALLAPGQIYAGF
jgi:hypothetical protein